MPNNATLFFFFFFSSISLNTFCQTNNFTIISGEAEVWEATPSLQWLLGYYERVQVTVDRHPRSNCPCVTTLPWSPRAHCGLQHLSTTRLQNWGAREWAGEGLHADVLSPCLHVVMCIYLFIDLFIYLLLSWLLLFSIHMYRVLFFHGFALYIIYVGS